MDFDDDSSNSEYNLSGDSEYDSFSDSEDDVPLLSKRVKLTREITNDKEAEEDRFSSLPREITNDKEAEEDRFSSLPNSLLLHILSFLSDTKEVVRTCLLSKRWEFVWTDLSEVYLREGSYDYAKRCRTVGWVARMFASCKYLNKFHVSFVYDKRFASDVNYWVKVAIKGKVKDIALDLKYSGYELPQRFYSYSSLTDLYLNGCVIAPPRIIAWGSLKSLCMHNMKLLDSVLKNILSGCHVLEVLKLKRCWGSEKLNIYSPNLITLEIEDHIHDVLLSAPYIQVLLIKNMSETGHIRLGNVLSVAHYRVLGQHYL